MTEGQTDRGVSDAEELARLASGLADAWERAETVPAPSIERPATTIEEAYRIQEMIIERRLSSGRRRAGWKMGLTSSPGTEPIVGTLLDDMVVGTGVDLSLAALVEPLLEAEIAVVIGEHIAADSDVETIAAGAHSVAAALEVIDYRTKGAAGAVDWVADNATVAFAVVSEAVPFTEVPSLAGIGVELFGGAESMAAGDGSLVMGDPLRALQWLATHLARRGHALDAGDVVLTGSLTGHHRAVADVVYTARFDQIGSAAVRFVV
ncbi:2-oxo-hepta-3-ene-1,7-dioic acid hydratase [soil metagenome]